MRAPNHHKNALKHLDIAKKHLEKANKPAVKKKPAKKMKGKSPRKPKMKGK